VTGFWRTVFYPSARCLSVDCISLLSISTWFLWGLTISDIHFPCYHWPVVALNSQCFTLLKISPHSSHHPKKRVVFWSATWSWHTCKGAGKGRKKSSLCCSCKTSFKKLSQKQLTAGAKSWNITFRLHNKSLEEVILV